jgi:hypothetical protein
MLHGAVHRSRGRAASLRFLNAVATPSCWSIWSRSWAASSTPARGWGQPYVYLADTVRLNLGYGIDNAQNAGRFSLKASSATFANVVSDVNPSLHLGLEGNDRLTTHNSFGDKKAWLVISEVLFRL